MRKFLTILLAATVVAFASCKKDKDDLPVIEFEKTNDFLSVENDIELKVILSQPAGEALSVPIVLSGSAVKDTDYEIENEMVVVPAGAREAIVKFTSLGVAAGDKNIRVGIGNVNGYVPGNKSVCIISITPREDLIWTFTQTNDELPGGGDVSIEIKLKGQITGNSYKAPAKITIPFSVMSSSTAVASNYSVKDGATAFVVEKGQNTASITLIAGTGFTGAETPKLFIDMTLDAGDGFVEGDNASTKITLIRSFNILSNIVGTWKYSSFELTDNVNCDYWLLDMLCDPTYGGSGDDLDKLPKTNTAVGDTFSITSSGGTYTLTPTMTGDVKNYFRTATISVPKYNRYSYYYLSNSKFHTMECTLSQVNHIFASLATDAKAAQILFNLSDDNNTLDVFITDYRPTDFLDLMYNHDEFGTGEIFGEQGDNIRYFHLWYKFTRVTP